MKTIKAIGPGILCLFAWSLLNGCGGDNQPFEPPRPGDALIFAFPMQGMTDVPLTSKGLLVFSSPVDAQAVTRPCRAGDDGVPEGGFCVTGPDGLVDISARTTVINDGRTIQFTLDDLAPGAEYRVWVRPAAAPDAVNLKPDNEALLSFRTRQNHPLPDAAPRVIAVNQQTPDAFLPGSDRTPRFPFMDFSPIRVTFSEPLDQNTVTLSDGVHLVKVSEDGAEQTVPVGMLAERHYLSLQPDQDLEPGARHELRLTGLRDLNNEVLPDTTLVFVPNSSKARPGDANPPIDQTLQTWPALGDARYPNRALLSGGELNRFSLSNVALGEYHSDSLPNALRAYLADPKIYPHATPVVARGGQSLRITGIDAVALGGEVSTDLSTGLITGTFINNVTGYMTPNPFRPEGFQPDDDYAPLYVYMNFDLALQTEDSAGNASLNQNLMHIQAVGVVTVDDRKLTFQVFRTLQLEVLGGATTISADFNLGVRSDPDLPVDMENQAAPRITGAYPADGATGVETSENILLTFSEPLAKTGLDRLRLLNLSSGGGEVPIQVKRSGTSLVVSPQTRLQADSEYLLQLGAGLRDLHLFEPRDLASDPQDALGGNGELRFTTADYRRTESGDMPPLVLGLYPGIGCALVDTQRQPDKTGRCQGGQASDTLYPEFLYEVSRPIQITFSQPMDTESMRVGTVNAAADGCLDGAVCLARRGGDGWSPIPMSLVAENMAATLRPAEGALAPGDGYRLVVNGNENGFRNHPELGHLRINTTPLVSLADPGGPNIVIDFTAVAPFDTIADTVRTRPFTDTNGSGFQDQGEPAEGINGARGAIDGVGGVLTSGGFADPEKDRIFISGGLPMAFLPKQPLDLSLDNLGMVREGQGRWCLAEADPKGNRFCMNTRGDYMIPVEVNPQIILGTALTVRATALGLIPLTLSTRGLPLRIKPRESGQMFGYLVNLEGEAKPHFMVRLNAWLDAPDLRILGGLAGHDVHSKEVVAYLFGPVSFLKDGRIKLSVTNVNAIVARINVNLLDIEGANAGYADLLLDKGEFNIQVMNHPSRARRIAEPLR